VTIKSQLVVILMESCDVVVLMMNHRGAMENKSLNVSFLSASSRTSCAVHTIAWTVRVEYCCGDL
jgi:hypothetical protein